jgi:hypothetical protein
MSLRSQHLLLPTVLSAAVLYAVPAKAQLGERVRGLLNSTPEYDTSYVELQRDLWTASVVSRVENVEIELTRTGGAPLAYNTNSNARYGFALNHRWLGLEFTFNVPEWEGAEVGGQRSLPPRSTS